MSTKNEITNSFSIETDELSLNNGLCRIDVNIPDSWLQADEYDQVVFDLGQVDGANELWLNGELIGRTGFIPEGDEYDETLNSPWWENRFYYVPKDRLKSNNVLEIRTNANALVCPLKVGLVHRTHDESLMTPAHRYAKMMRGIEKGWNSWDTRSVFTQLLLPETFSIKLSFLDGDEVNDDIRIGNPREDAAVVRPYDHTWDGRYTECDASWRGMSVKLRTSSSGDDLVMLVSPLERNDGKGRLRIIPGFCWEQISDVAGGSEQFVLDGDVFYLYREDWSVALKGRVVASDLRCEGDFYTCSLDEPVLVTVGPSMSVDEASKMLDGIRDEIDDADRRNYGSCYDAYHAMQTILAWDTIFDPDEEVVVSPVSRNWNGRFAAVNDFGGYVLFDWDTYFASQMLSVSCRELAYANAVEVTSRADKLGFVPKDHCDHNSMTEDCSQPPVGSMNIWKIYERYGEKWFLELVYDRLLAWNRWWPEARQTDGLLCWGSNKVRIRGGERDSGSKHNSVLESGLDNSHMYDDARYDPVTCQLKLQDVGLTSMYVMDCDYLVKIAKEIGRLSDVREISSRADKFRKNISRFWCEEDGMFYNIVSDTGEFDKHISPTNFYVFLAKAATKEQARIMVERHLLNEDEFWGEWVIPNAPRNDPAFADQDYWRGRIWGPTNYLVYLGLQNYDFPEVRRQFAEKSEKLLMKDWTDRGYIYENWNALTGDGGDRSNCDSFYHWGALLGYIYMLENQQMSDCRLPIF